MIYEDAGSVPQAVKYRYYYEMTALPDEAWSGPVPFYRWLEVAWRDYLRVLKRGDCYAVYFSGDLLKYRMFDLFNRGLVIRSPVHTVDRHTGLLDEKPWLKAGLVMEKADYTPRFVELDGEVRSLLHEEEPPWGLMARLWGELTYLNAKTGSEMEPKHVTGLVPEPDSGTESDPSPAGDLDQKINEMFEQFILNEYDKLFFGGFSAGPVTVDQVIRYAGSRPGDKKAIICFDGMGFPEWFCLKEHLAGRGIN